MSEETNKNQYSADSIQALEGMEHVRMRPSMYIGDVGVRGLHHLVYEVVDNSIDEALAGHCKNIDIKIRKNERVIAKNSSSIGSAKLLPNINILGGASINNGESNIDFATNEFPNINSSESESSSSRVASTKAALALLIWQTTVLSGCKKV